MAKINVESGGAAPLSSGVLQLNNGVAMSSTLTPVTDQSNTASPLSLATTGVQVNSTLEITTDSNPYIDAEDGLGNNRFQVGRDPSSQVVNIDFASNPTGGTNLVGGIRTYTDGVNLAQVMTFRKDGNIGIGTTTPGAKLDVHSASNTIVQLNRTGTGNSQIQHLMTGTARWSTGYVNTNGNYSFYDDVNAVFRANLSNTGRLTIGNGDNVGTGQLTVRGSGSTSATTSLLVQNSGGTTALQVTDDGNTSFTTASGATVRIGDSTTDIFRILNTYQRISVQPVSIGGSITLNAGTEAGASYTVNDNGHVFAYPFNRTTANTFTINREFYGNVVTGTKTMLNITTSNIGGLSNATLLRGVYFAPTTTDWTEIRAFESTAGGAYINTSSVNASAILQADSTTKGFLPPRMTNAQRAAITTPAIGLMVYCTDAVEGLYIYKSTGWTFVI